jgi:hypothetical protein
MSSQEPEATYSISLRLRRTTTEYAYVSVPVVGDLVKPDEQGVGRIDVEALTQWAVEMGRRPEVVWYRETEQIKPHPLQKDPDLDERRYPG